MKASAIVLSTSPFKFNDREGKVVSGVNFFYLITDSLQPTSEDEQGRRGTDPQQGRLPFETVTEFVEVPGLYEIDFIMRTSARNIGGAMTVTGIKFKGNILAALS